MTSSVQSPLVLVVDDDAMMRLLVRETLEQCAFRVAEAEDGRACLARFEEARPDIVLLDVMMPVLDGFDTCIELRKLPGGAHTPVLMMTGLDDPESVNRAYEAGATDFITKPISWPLLGHRVRYMLRAAAAIHDLAESQARLASAQRIAQLGHWDWDLDSDQVRRSEEVYRIIGRGADEFASTHKTFLEIIHPDDRSAVEDALWEAVQRHRPYSVDFRVVRPDGSTRIVHEYGEVHYDAHGKPLYMQGTTQDITERVNAEQRIRHLALYDRLTGLANRELFQQQVEQVLAEAKRHRRTMATLCLDLDRFARINDTLGHAAGDALLKQVAERLMQIVRTSDAVVRLSEPPCDGDVARFAGDEFAVLLSELGQGQDAAKVAQRFHDMMAPPFLLDGQEVFVTISVGISVYPDDGAESDALLRNAHAAMRHAKDQGRNNFQFYSGSLHASAREKLSLENDLRRALERDEFVVYYQPQIDVQTGTLVGVEALVRWQHPERGLVPPLRFIPLAEETGLIVPIGECVLRKACRQNKAWQAAGFAPIRVAVNMASANFRQPYLAETVDAALAESALDARYLELEMTESALMQDLDSTLAVLNRLKQMGVALSIDDFGTGYSSLSYLKRFPIDCLKIDQSFVRDIPADADDAALVEAIIAMARSLKLGVVAEGVETAEQAAFLAERECDYMQGYLYSKPVAAEDITRMLQNNVRFAPAVRRLRAVQV
ncbi:MAG TPA: EAL domain-containing protein [Burkholderiales bacterium]|nr:EAL domain-containing protein [Burkholderiales bacterium]